MGAVQIGLGWSGLGWSWSEDLAHSLSSFPFVYRYVKIQSTSCDQSAFETWADSRLCTFSPSIVSCIAWPSLVQFLLRRVIIHGSAFDTGIIIL